MRWFSVDFLIFVRVYVSTVFLGCPILTDLMTVYIIIICVAIGGVRCILGCSEKSFLPDSLVIAKKYCHYILEAIW